MTSPVVETGGRSGSAAGGGGDGPSALPVDHFKGERWLARKRMHYCETHASDSVDVPAVVAAGVSMTIFAAAYLGEIWRGSIEAVPKGQHEAAESLGLTRLQSMVFVILPQAVRLSIPPTVGFMVQIVKNTSYAVVIGFTELTQSGKIVNNVIFQPFLVFTIVGAVYFCLCSPLSRASRKLDSRMRARGA